MVVVEDKEETEAHAKQRQCEALRSGIPDSTICNLSVGIWLVAQFVIRVLVFGLWLDYKSCCREYPTAGPHIGAVWHGLRFPPCPQPPSPTYVSHFLIVCNK